MVYSFDSAIAKKYGVDEAIVIHNLTFWIAKNKANGKHLHEGRTWTYNSAKAFQELFDFWTEKQIYRIIESLISQGVIMSGNFNQIGYDRTRWYAFVDESIFLNSNFHFTKRGNGFPETVGPIPDIKPYVSTDTKPDIDELSLDPSPKSQDKGQEKRHTHTFTRPTLEEIKQYVSERGIQIDPERFFAYYEAGGWVDAKGNRVRNWKQKAITWGGRGKTSPPPTPSPKVTARQRLEEYRFTQMDKRDHGEPFDDEVLGFMLEASAEELDAAAERFVATGRWA